METSQKINEWRVSFDKDLSLAGMASFDKSAVRARLHNNQSLGAIFRYNDEYQFSAIFDIDEGFLHVREVYGDFLPNSMILDNVSQGLAKYLKMDVITFNTKSRAIARIAEKMGYSPTHEQNEFLKRIA